MDVRNRRALKSAAAEVLHRPSGNPGRLVLIYAGALAALSLVSLGLNFYLAREISGTGGLGGMGMRSILQTLEQLLSLANSFLPAFWSLGFLYALLKLSRRQETRDADLFQGFRCFGPVLRLTLLQNLLYFGVLMAGYTLGSALLSFTPLAAPFAQQLALLGEDITPEALLALDEKTLLALVESMIPLMLGCLAVGVVLAVPVVYRLRLAGYFLLDAPQEGAIAAMIRSNRAMRGHGWQLAALDLSFWWYFLGELLLVVLAYTDVLLRLLGVTLPVSSTAFSLGCYAVSLLAQLGFYYLVLAKVELSYIQFYEAVRPQPQTPPAGQ